MTRGARVKGEARNRSDLYPTSSDACVAIGRWLADNHPERYNSGTWLDPTAGFGTLLEWSGIDHERRIAMELSRDEFQLSELRKRVAPHRLTVGVDSLSTPWPESDGILANYPFVVLNGLIERTIQAHLDTGAIAALFTPCAFWHAQGRSDMRKPDVLLALGWRPNSSAGFRKDGTSGASPAQDYYWVIYDGTRHPKTEWIRIERPSNVPQAWVDEHKRLAQYAATFKEPDPAPPAPALLL